MGGAARNARKSRQQAAAARSVAQARGSKSDRNKIIAVVVAVVVVAALVIGGVLWINSSKNATQDSAIQPGTTSSLGPGVVEKRDGAVVSVGKPGASKTIDLYADFLCPYCAKLQQDFGPRMEKAINDGQLTVRYHMVILLNKNSDPPGYSLDSANAALAAADQQKFTAFHDALFKNQPQEGGRGYDKAQLIKLGQDLGISDPKFAQTVNAGTYDQQLQTAFQQVQNDPKLQQDFGNGQVGFGTPTVAVDGKAVPAQGDWLAKILGG
ncbi:thioredoxin domain-containing protein [Amycolatopsis rubida]|uniref:Protein-disulfide isomerase n=1 Tax=Amycolatopsis rubida TaxID=112413 RepID=A0A1I5NWJ6_9PSEU|nr:MULTISPECIES: thioredoxin domain-containing protein [Amycolatopsis]MYW91128.1 thioredoxin domain-containing protein [Amycolatopsis rubida]NEC56113.1 thioredoxin domain-containing protein [Amycolatopsis rubida]OAP20977.1 Serine/threonine-protein kinase PknE [Amycolatopsis sp. M39]SFP26153.1 Protein-disulfide isomerase [Amycolatopsis rubida]